MKINQLLLLLVHVFILAPSQMVASSLTETTIHTVRADGVDVFYRASGAHDAPVLLLLHGFPTSSHSYRHLLAGLSDKYRVIAPDLPGFGFTVVPEERKYAYTFANFAKTVEAFVDALSLDKYAIYIFDYGAPTGLRLALSRPDSITAIISQNGNAFEEGLGDFWDTIAKYWDDPTQANRDSIRPLTTFEGTKTQYVTGESSPSTIPPETWWLDWTLLQRPGIVDIQLDIFYDYRTNVDLYPTFQKYLSERQPPLLAVWGKNDVIFVPAGAEKFKTVLKDAEVHLIDAGHFALENHHEEIIKLIRAFLAKKGI